MENAYYVSGIVLAFLAFVSAIYAAIQYFYGKKREKVQKACELAKFFADEIIPRASIISWLIVHKAPNEINEYEKLYFTKKEAISIIKKHNLLPDGEGEEKILTIDVSKMIEYRAKIPHFADTIRIPNPNDFSGSGTEQNVRNEQIKHVASSLAIQTESYILKYINDLEWFCMNFQHGIADESVVYQSLHSSFLASVKELYFFISYKNVSGPADKYFTNIMDMYNHWLKRENKVKSKIEKEHMKNEETGVTRGKRA